MENKFDKPQKKFIYAHLKKIRQFVIIFFKSNKKRVKLRKNRLRKMFFAFSRFMVFVMAYPKVVCPK